MPLLDKMRTIAREIYRADDIARRASRRRALPELEEQGFGKLPVCMAKTQYSFTADPVMGAPSGFSLPIREVRLSAGAGFVVALCGDIMTMPGLPRTPAANAISVGPDGQHRGPVLMEDVAAWRRRAADRIDREAHGDPGAAACCLEHFIADHLIAAFAGVERSVCSASTGRFAASSIRAERS